MRCLHDCSSASVLEARHAGVDQKEQRAKASPNHLHKRIHKGSGFRATGHEHADTTDSPPKHMESAIRVCSKSS